MQSYLKSLTTKIYYYFYNWARYSHKFLKQILKVVFYNHSNPYNYISRYPLTLEISIIDQDYVLNGQFPKYTIITPVLNEEKSILEMLKTVEAQTFAPDQVIIIDGGSTDLTMEKIKEYKKSSKLEILLLSSPVKNIGHQRNIGIDNARNNLLVNVDAGTHLTPNYTANLLGPFTEYEGLDLVCGVFYPKESYTWSVHFSPAKHFELLKEPYGACLAYKRDIALKIGKYPEYLTYAGEDTLFCYKYKKLSKKWVFNRNAVILWEHPASFVEAKKKLLNYLIANFEIGLWPYLYSSYLYESQIIIIGLNHRIFHKNYKELLKRQVIIEIEKRKIKGLCFMITEGFIHEIINPNGLRNLAINLIKNNYKVFFINTNKKTDLTENQIFIDTDHTLLELIPGRYFNIEEFKDRYGEFLSNAAFVIQCPNKAICSQIFELKKHIKDMKIIYNPIENPSQISDLLSDDYMIQNSDWIIASKDIINDFQDKESNKAYIDKFNISGDEAEQNSKIQAVI